MATPEELRDARKSYSVSLHAIIREHSNDNLQIFLLVEGKDSDYFRPRISSVFSGSDLKLHFKNIHGKSNLKNLYRSIRGNIELQNSRVCTFYDRDYEQDIAEISHDRSFITDVHSIENYYVTDNSFSSMIKSIFFADSINVEEDEAVLKICM